MLKKISSCYPMDFYIVFYGYFDGGDWGGNTFNRLRTLNGGVEAFDGDNPASYTPGLA